MNMRTPAKLGAAAIAILREAVRLGGLNERSARTIGVDVAQLQHLEARGLLSQDPAKSV